MTVAIRPLACSLVFVALAGHADAAQIPPTPAPMQGFSPARATAQADLERRFDALLDARDQRAWLQQMASEPNQVGAPHDKANAEFMLAQFKSWGWDARIETFEVLYPTPKSVALEMLAPNAFTAKLHEPAIEGDATSAKTGTLPPYNVYGADGDVTGELVYVNYGMPDDYKALAQRGIDVKGRIVITRYGGGWRGLKPKLAYEHGAIGCLIYSDPHDDGYQRGDTYPKGGFRPADGVQRGSVQDMQQYPGDPLTPNVGATKDAKRLSIAEAKTILKIPVLPISYADAQPLLAALDGPVAPPEWRGALPITYHLGPGAANVRLAISSDWSQKTIYDVIAVMKGSRYPDQWIVRGNHHDGWVFGAWDPLAGNVALMAEVKAIGALAKSGWRPQRTLVYASWDAEEPGLLGSTEWAEAHADELRKKAVVYVNSDTNGRGFLGAEGSHSLQHLVNDVANDVIDPQTHVSVMKRLRAKLQVDALDKGTSEERKRLAKFAASAGLSLQEFRKQFEYLVQYEPPPLAMDAHMGGFVETPGA
jgi:N-acetylated-alpha-linked acidic dipeptidase